jgi:MFS family permease
MPVLTSYLAALRSLSRNARLYLVSNAIQAVSAGALAIFYTLFLSALGFSKDAIGQTVFFGVLGAALGILPAGWLLDRVGWRATLIWSNLMGGVALLTQWLAPTLTVVSITSVIVGASVAMYLVVNGPLLTATSTPSERTALFGVSTALLFLVGVIGTLLGGALPDWMASSAVQHSPLVVALSPLLRADPHVRAYQLALVVAGIAAVPSLIPILMMREVRAVREPRSSLAWQWNVRAWRERLAKARPLVTGPIGRFGVAQGLLGMGAGLYYPFLSLFFVEHLHATTTGYGFITSGQTVLIAATALVGSMVAERFGKLRFAMIAQAASLPFLAALGLAPVLALAIGLLLTRSAVINLGNAPLNAWYMEVVPAEHRGVASSVANGAWQGAWALGALAGGHMFDRLGYPGLFGIAAVLYACSISLMVWWFLRGDGKPRSVKDGLGLDLDLPARV